MSVRITYECNGCSASPETVKVEQQRNVIGQAVIGGVLCDRIAKRNPSIEDSAPEGWVAFDPYTACTYCPTCWSEIEKDCEAEHPSTQEGGR